MSGDTVFCLVIKVKMASDCRIGSRKAIFTIYSQQATKGGGGCYCSTSDITSGAIIPGPLFYVLMVLQNIILYKKHVFIFLFALLII